MIDRIEQLLRMHGYAKSDANEEIFYVKVIQNERKGIYILENIPNERAYQKFQEGKEILGEDAGILILIFQNDQKVSWIDYERQFDELQQPISMMLESMPERKDKKSSVYIPKMTILLVVVNVILFIATKIMGEAIYQWGASSWPLIVGEHQWYRLFTSNYLHFGFDHLFNNMAVLCILGYEVEKKMGSLRYVMLYIGAGLIGSIASVGYYMATNQNVVSVGASGAIFGLVGALLIIVLKNRERKNGFYKRGFIIVIVGSLYHGISSAGIDNAAHVGGLIGGAILAFILYRQYREK